MNINIIKNIVVTFLFLNVLFSGTVYLSKSLDSISKFHIDETSVSGDGNDIGGFFSETYALGYYHPVWKKRKIQYNVNLGFEYMQNDNFSFLSFYTMLNWDPIKKLTTSFLVGLNFYDHENEYFNQQDYYPDSKGGQVYGIAVTYNFKNKYPISLDYKVNTYSEVHSDVWLDIEYSRCAISLGYKF